MTRFTQMHASFDEATLDSLQRAYDDFCRDTGMKHRPSNAAQDHHASGGTRAQTSLREDLSASVRIQPPVPRY